MEPNDKELFKQLQDIVREYDEWKKKNMILGGQLSSPVIGPAYTTATGSPTPKPPGRPVGSKTKDKEVIIQETVDRLIDQVVKLLTKHNFDEDRLNDADITVDEKSNYAFVTVTVGLPNGSIISVSERVKVANKTDYNAYKNAQKASNTLLGGLSIAKAIDDGLVNSYFKNNDK